MIYRNPEKVFIVIHHPPTKANQFGLGYVRFEAPKSKSKQLKQILKNFRGPRELTFRRADGSPWDYQGEDLGGIVTYVKEESPRDAQFI